MKARLLTRAREPRAPEMAAPGVGNAKAFIIGTYHGLGAKHLQAYLDEFCFRFNRRHGEGLLFDRLLNACISTSSTVTYEELTSHVAT